MGLLQLLGLTGHKQRHKADSLRTEWQPGPRFRTLDAYLLPRNVQEMRRLDFQHYLLKHVLKGNYVAPLERVMVHRILDVGCGTGRWAQEMTLAFPEAHVVGFDLAEHYQVLLPDMGNNYSFQQGNLLDGLPFVDNSFDFTHQRLLAVAIPATRWPFVLSELVRVTRPGGWIELLEASDHFEQPGPWMQQVLQWWQVVGRARGFDLTLITRLGEGLKQAGLGEVQTQIIELPLGPWMPGKQREGILLQQDMLSGLREMRDLFCREAAVREEEVERTLAALPEEWVQYRTAYRFHLIYGRKI